jgi:phytoene dehydrogenase-like protein
MSDVLIVGAGLAGLSCALELEQRGFSCLVLEASDGVGGRVRTDEINGFRLDRGFQVLLEAYPECRRVLDYSQLQLKSFEPGAVVWSRGKLRSLVDPRRRPSAILEDVFSPLASLADKLRMARYVLELERRSIDDLLSAPETSTAVALATHGFSPVITERFLRPFLGGIFLERQLATSSRKLDYVMRMFADGPASVPSLGMQAIPAQLAGRLRNESIRLNSPVRLVSATSVTLESGEQIDGKAVVIAADFAHAPALDSRITAPPANKVTCLYFMAHEPPLRGSHLVLNGEGESDGPVNNLAVMTEVSPAYGPPGTALIAVSVVGAARDARLEAPVRVQLSKWFGAQVSRWFLLKTYEIENALPRQTPQTGGLSARSARIPDGPYVCGDYCDTASINGAMLSGRRAAEAVMEDLGRN